MRTDTYEIQIMKNLQELNIDNECRYISKPFNTISFIILMIIFYFTRVLNIKELLFIISSSLLTFTLKKIFIRKRPYQNNKIILNKSKKNYNEEKIKLDYYSFPSGHALTSTVFSLILLNKYGYANFISLIPILVGFSRIYLGVHYPSDVIFGIIFGSLYFSLIKKYL